MRSRGGLSGGLGKRQHIVLCTWAGTFPYLFFRHPFFTQDQDFERTWWSKWSAKLVFSGAVFKQNESKIAFRLHRHARIACEPPPWNAQSGSNYIQNTHTESRILFFAKQVINSNKITQQKGLNKWFSVVGTALGRALAHHWCSCPLFNTETVSNVVHVQPGVENRPKK